MKITGAKALTANLTSLSKRVDPAVVLPIIGRRLCFTEIPLVFKRQGPGWKAPRCGGQALRDRGILMGSFVWHMEGSKKLVVGTAHPGAKTLNEGAPPILITPKHGEWLTIPIADNLTTTERQTFRLRSYSGVFFRKSKKHPDRLVAYQSLGKGKVRALAVLVKGIGGEGQPQIKKRTFLSWRLYRASALAAAERYIGKAQIS